MLWLVAITAISVPTALTAPAAPSARPGAVVVQAQATVRILSGVRLKLDSSTNADAPPAHDSRVLASDGIRHPARLIEFE
jgi:hypothetical protein